MKLRRNKIKNIKYKGHQTDNLNKINQKVNYYLNLFRVHNIQHISVIRNSQLVYPSKFLKNKIHIN